MHHEPHAMDPVRIFTRARAAIPLLSHHTCTPAHPTASADSSQVQHTDDHLASDAELHTFTLTPGFTLACWRDTKRKSKPGVEAVHPSRRGTVPEIPAPLSRGPLPERGKFPSFETQGHGFEQGTGPFCLPHTTTLGPAEEKKGVHCKKPPYAAGNALQVPCYLHQCQGAGGEQFASLADEGNWLCRKSEAAEDRKMCGTSCSRPSMHRSHKIFL